MLILIVFAGLFIGFVRQFCPVRVALPASILMAVKLL